MIQSQSYLRDLPTMGEHVKVVVAEWLRRWTRNPLGSPRAGSNPADYEEQISILALHRERFRLFGNKEVRTHCTLTLNLRREQEDLIHDNALHFVKII